MVGKVTHEVLPGGLSERDKDVIAAEFERGRKAHTIAREIRKHPSTVQWFLYREGLQGPRYGSLKPYRRGGRWVTPFSPEEDAFIVALRLEGLGPTQIARRASARFDTQRNMHTIQCRLVMLAARDTATEAA